MEHEPRVAAVIATRNRRDELDRTLDRLTGLPDRPEIVVVDNGSTDGTARAARRPGVRVIELGRNAGPAARTIGAREANAPYAALTDDDSWWQPGSLTRAADVLDELRELGLVAARVLVGTDGREDETTARMSASPLRADGLPGPVVLGFLACGAVVRRSAFLAVGGFDGRLGFGGEETLLALDLTTAGWRAVYADDVVAEHHPASNGYRPGRIRTLARNAAWTAWLRRRPGGVASVTTELVRAAARNVDVRHGLRDAARHGAWTLLERRPVDRTLEAAIRAVERQGL